MKDLKKFDWFSGFHNQCRAWDLTIEQIIVGVDSNSAATGPGFSGPARRAPKPEPPVPTGPPRVPMAGTRKLGDSHA